MPKFTTDVWLLTSVQIDAETEAEAREGRCHGSVL